MQETSELTVRQVAMLADNQSARAMAHVGTLGDRMNDLVTDNATLLNEVMRLRNVLEMLALVVDDLDQRLQGGA